MIIDNYKTVFSCVYQNTFKNNQSPYYFSITTINIISSFADIQLKLSFVNLSLAIIIILRIIFVSVNAVS